MIPPDRLLIPRLGGVKNARDIKGTKIGAMQNYEYKANANGKDPVSFNLCPSFAQPVSCIWKPRDVICVTVRMSYVAECQYYSSKALK